MKKRKKHTQAGAPPWLVSMGDMNNLLMCFFIVLMGDISVVVQEDFQLVASFFQGNVSFMTGGKSLSAGRLAEMGQNIMTLPSARKGKALDKAYKRMVDVLKADVRAKKVRVFEDERGLVISLSSDVFFDSGSAVLKEEVRPVLGRISTILRGIENFIRIEGYTDARAVTPAQVKRGYETNWELSSARSVNVLRYLAEEETVNPAQLSASAFGEFRPIDENDTPEGRAYNRRVDIVIVRERFLEKSKDRQIPRPLPDEEWR